MLLTPDYRFESYLSSKQIGIVVKILIGSQALKYYFKDYPREPHDTDYFSDELPDLKDLGIESFYNTEILRWWRRNNTGVATVDELFTIKISHIFWAPLGWDNWRKHFNDIVWMQNNTDAQLIPELYYILYGIWEERYGKKQTYLNATAAEFFNNKIERIYDHDSLHVSIAYYDRPLFESILKDGAEVMVDKRKFDALQYDDRLKLVREEVYATALERFIIPNNYKYPKGAAYNQALQKTICSFMKGEFALWIALHLKDLYRPDIDYVCRHKCNKHKLIKLEGKDATKRS